MLPPVITLHLMDQIFSNRIVVLVSKVEIHDVCFLISKFSFLQAHNSIGSSYFQQKKLAEFENLSDENIGNPSSIIT